MSDKLVYFPPSPEQIKAAIEYADRMDEYVRAMYGSSGVMYTYQEPLSLSDFEPLFFEDCVPKQPRRVEKSPLFGAPYGHKAYFQRPSEMLDEVHKPWINYPIQGMISAIEAKVRDSFKVDAAMLYPARPEYTADALTLTFKSTEAYFDKLRDSIPMPHIESWPVESWFLIYIQRQPCIFTCGFGPAGVYYEEGPKRFTSARKARAWARKQVGCMVVSMVLQPSGPFNWTNIEVIPEGAYD